MTNEYIFRSEVLWIAWYVQLRGCVRMYPLSQETEPTTLRKLGYRGGKRQVSSLNGALTTLWVVDSSYTGTYGLPSEFSISSQWSFSPVASDVASDPQSP